MKSFLEFKEIKQSIDTNKEYGVCNKRGAFLGYIAYHKRWKKYAYYPDEMMFEKEIYLCSMCLKEIVLFLDKINVKDTK